MFLIGNEIIDISLEKGTQNTPTDEYYLFKDKKLIAKDKSYKKLKVIFDKIVDDNKEIIKEATRELRESPVENKTILRNWMNTVSNNSLLGGSTIKQSKNRRFSKIR